MLAFFMRLRKEVRLTPSLQVNFFTLLDHKHASLFKKEANRVFSEIYLKKLLTDLTQLRIMRAVPDNKATRC